MKLPTAILDERLMPRRCGDIRLSRRKVLGSLALLPVIAFAQGAPTVVVWKTATCGCCRDWVRYLQDNGFRVVTHDVEDTSVARRHNGIPDDYGSCHSALVAGYALEGHVPAGEILRLLRERPRAIGLSVPSMPLGAPGMDGAQYGGRKIPYEVLLLQEGGKASVYQAYR